MAKNKKNRSLYELYKEEQEKLAPTKSTHATGTRSLRELYNAENGITETEENSALKWRNDEIAPVRETKEEEKEEKQKWYEGWTQKGGLSALDDGFQLSDIGDIFKTSLATTADLKANLGGGILEMGEGLADALTYLGGLGAKKAGYNKLAEGAKKLAAEDLYDGEKIASYLVSPENWALKAMGEDYDELSTQGEKLDSLVQSGGQLLGTVGLQAVGVPWFLTTGVTSFGGGVEEAFNEGADYAEAGLSAAITAGADILTEKLFGGSGLGEKGLINLDGLTKGISKKAVKALVDFGIDITAEGFEEVGAGILSNLGSALYKEENLKDILFSEEAVDEYIESFIGGAVLGGGMNAVKVGKSVKQGTDYRTGLTANEQKVFDKAYNDAVAEAEKGGKKLSKNEKAKIYDNVMEKLEKGYISTDIVEEVLDGKTFGEYKSLTEREKALTDEISQLENLPKEQITVKQSERLSAAREELKNLTNKDELKSRLTDGVKSQIDAESKKLTERGSYLAESYNEIERRGQAFTADLSKYDSKRRTAVERAIKSGVLNNTNRSHELVDVLSKIEADKGIVFDYTNNAKLKESGFALDGKTINGFVKNGTVTLNVHSPKAWQSTVGHEVTHILEGTESYGELRQALFAYAESKGELASRKAALTELYKGVDADIDAELTADLVGDYLFNDGDFIKNLTTNKTVFQKIYDEIKYLCKVATGKEKADIEKVKREFDKVWESFSAEDVAETANVGADNVKYSISGEKALTANNSKLYDAMRRTAFGEDAETVRKDTGWYKGKDNKWRFYIPDNEMEVVGSIGTNNSVTLGNYIKHHKLFTAYPDLKNVNVRFGNLKDTKNGQYSPENNEIVLNNKLRGDIEKQKNTLIHEIQHAIQGIEDFAVGGNKSTGFAYAFNMAYDKVKKSTEFGQLKDKKEKLDYIVSVAKNLFNASSERDLQYKAYRSLYGEAEARQVAQNRVFDEDLLRLATPDTSGNVINLEHETKKFIDNFTEIGYTEEEIVSLLEGVQDDKSGSIGDIESGSQGNEDFGMLQRGQFHLVIPTDGFDGAEGGTQGTPRDNRRGVRAIIPQLSNTLSNTGGLGGRVTTDNTNEIAPMQEASSEDGVFFDAGNSLKTATNPDIRFSAIEEERNEKSGVKYDKSSQSYSPVRYSIGSWSESDYVTERQKVAKEMANSLGVTEERASKYIDDVNSIAKMIADDKSRLSYEPSPNRSAFVSNAEYGGSIDFSTICKKRRLFTGTFEAIQNALPNTALTADEVLEIRKMMKDKGYEVSCGLCYVEGSRTNMGQYTKQFIERYKGTNPEYVPNMAEMNTATGQEQIRKEHPEVYEAYEYFMNHYGRLTPTDKAIFASQQKPKMYQMATEYKGEILDNFGKKNGTVEAKNKNGGLRLQSFSDFEIIHLIDSMQVIMDMSRVGLAGQAYTKVPDFAWALGDTGLKINLSLIAKGVDENGKLILDEVEGMKESDAMALRNRYSNNVGTIIVTFTDEQLKAAMADERIDYIIPYHRSQWKTDQYDMMGLPKSTKDYTNLQNESYIEAVYNKNGKKQRPNNYMPNTYWDFSKSGKENAETYLKMCAENNRKPKFSHLLVDNQDGSYSLQPDGSTDGYWKTLIDFKMYNNDGTGAPQNPVTPDFNMEEAQRMLNEYTGGHAKFPVAQDIVDEFVSKHPDNIAPAKHSLSSIGEQPSSIGTPLQELSLAPMQEDIAPTPETVAENTTIDNDFDAPMPTDADAPFPDAIAPMTEEEANALQDEKAKADANVEGPPKTRKQLHSNIINDVKATFSSSGFDFDDVLESAKNLSTFSTVDNTPQRVMEKALGYKEGQVLADLTVNKVAQNETKGIKWLNSFTDRKNGLLARISKQYNIKPGSKESAAAQMYAEGFYVNDNNDIVAYGDAELAQDFPDVNVRNNIKGLAKDQRIRQIYDETLNAINASRTRNAYPEIQRLDNYFLHFRAMEDTFSRLGLPFNPNDIRAKDLPTDLNGVTADLKPGQPYFASAMHRKGKRTSFDLLGGLERYLTSAKNQIYHIDDIQTLRALRNYIADTYGQANGLEGIDMLTEEEAQERIEQVFGSHLSTFAKFLNEEANVLAGKTALIDRGLEGIIGRRGMTFFDTVNKQVGSNMVGFNISSSLTNFIPVAQTFAKTNKFDFLKAFTQTVSNKFGSIYGKGDDFAENSPVIIRRKGADRFYRTPFQKAGDAGYALMSAVDDISTELIARTKYNELTRKGMDEQQAHFETDKWVSRLMGDRSLGQQPQLYNSKMLGIVTKFQLEVRNQLDSQFYDTIQEAKVSNEEVENALARNAKTAAKVTSTFVQLAVAQHLFGKAFESVAGYNPAFDIISILATMFGFDDDEESEDTALDNVEQGFLELLEDLPYTSTFTGGRIPISSALPISELIKGKDSYGNEKSRLETIGEAAPYYVLPGGYGQIKKTAQGLGMFNIDEDHPIAGSYTNSGNLRFPVEDTLGNRIQAGIFGQYASENAREYFDNGYAPLKEKQIQEYTDVDLPIADYWKYRDGLKGLKTNAEKADYINNLNIKDWQKSLLMNNILDRKEDVDMSNYDDYSSYEEFDYAEKNPEKYEFFKANGISYEDYANADEDGKAAYTWAYNNPEKYKVSKVVADSVVKYRSYTSDLYDIKADKDASGDTIVGSGKAKKVEYINNLDLDYGQKLVLFKMQYKSDDTYNADIINYINSLDNLTYDERVAIYTELGFTVKDGYVYWD